MVVKEFVCQARFLVEEDHGAEVGLLVGPRGRGRDGEFGEGVCVDQVVGAGAGGFHGVGGEVYQRVGDGWG